MLQQRRRLNELAPSETIARACSFRQSRISSLGSGLFHLKAKQTAPLAWTIPSKSPPRFKLLYTLATPSSSSTPASFRDSDKGLGLFVQASKQYAVLTYGRSKMWKKSIFQHLSRSVENPSGHFAMSLLHALQASCTHLLIWTMHHLDHAIWKSLMSLLLEFWGVF